MHEGTGEVNKSTGITESVHRQRRKRRKEKHNQTSEWAESRPYMEISIKSGGAGGKDEPIILDHSAVYTSVTRTGLTVSQHVLNSYTLTFG